MTDEHRTQPAYPGRDSDLRLVSETAGCAHHDECGCTYGRCDCAVGVAEAALRLLGLRIEDCP